MPPLKPTSAVSFLLGYLCLPSLPNVSIFLGYLCLPSLPNVAIFCLFVGDRFSLCNHPGWPDSASRAGIKGRATTACPVPIFIIRAVTQGLLFGGGPVGHEADECTGSQHSQWLRADDSNQGFFFWSSSKRVFVDLHFKLEKQDPTVNVQFRFVQIYCVCLLNINLATHRKEQNYVSLI